VRRGGEVVVKPATISDLEGYAQKSDTSWRCPSRYSASCFPKITSRLSTPSSSIVAPISRAGLRPPSVSPLGPCPPAPTSWVWPTPSSCTTRSPRREPTTPPKPRAS
jgi:hypothetical protein